jgi:hypothetical protein
VGETASRRRLKSGRRAKAVRLGVAEPERHERRDDGNADSSRLSLLLPLGGEVLGDHHECSRHEVFVDRVTTYVVRDEHSPSAASAPACLRLLAILHLVIPGVLLPGSMWLALFSSADTECGAATRD